MEEYEEICELNPGVVDEASVSTPAIYAAVCLKGVQLCRLFEKQTRIRPLYASRYKLIGDTKYEIMYLQLTKSNNWLKVHGYPMKRKVHH